MKPIPRRFRFTFGAVILCILLLQANPAFSQSRVASEMYRVSAQSLEQTESLDAFTLLNVYDAPLDDGAKAIVERNAKALSTFEAASQMPFGDWGFDPEDTIYAGKTLNNADELTDIVVLRARMRAASGQYAQALDDCYNIANLSRRFSVQPSLLRQLMQDRLFDKALAAAGLMLPDAPPDEVQKFIQKIDELRTPADPIDVALAQKQAYIWFYHKVVSDPDLRNKLDKEVISVGEIFGVKYGPTDVTDLVADPGVTEQIFADTESAFDKMIVALKSSDADRTQAVVSMARQLHNSHPLVRGAVQMVDQSYQLSLMQPARTQLLHAAAKICAEVPRPIDENQARQRTGPFQYSNSPGGFELLGIIEGVDQPVILRVGARPLRVRPATAPSPKAN